jgi:hypothetical protein
LFQSIKPKSRTQSFRIDDFETELDAENAAKKWRREFSNSLSMTSNMIRLVDDDTIEVQLDNGTMFTNIKFLDLCQRYKIYRHNAYARFKLGKREHYFHKYITGNDTSHHIDRNGLNNRLSNLADVTQDINNRHASLRKDNSLGITGVYKINTGYRAIISHEKIKYQKTFSIKLYGDNALPLAIKFRTDLAKKFNNTNGQPVNPDLFPQITIR